MSKTKKAFQCQSCGAVTSQWAGRCSDCGAWNSLSEVSTQDSPKSGRFANYSGSRTTKVQRLAEVQPEQTPRFGSGLTELDLVLGGGIVPGSVVLIGGDPGIGKSTLLLQCSAFLAAERAVLYVTGEESLQQVSLRAQRMGLAAGELRLLAETQVESILHHAREQQPAVMIIDSIQTLYTEQLQSAPGGVAQVRESAALLVRYAKESGCALFVVGHVTKEGALAGPRVLEHMVDAVLYFEGDSGSRFRVIRAVKNRFGAVNELGVFAMTDRGLRTVSNPSAIFLSRAPEPVAGSLVMVTWEGSRPLLVEVQALVDESHVGNPRRVTLGLDASRLAMLLALLHRHGGVATYDQDVFVNVVGGVKVQETGIDLALVLAVLSSLRNKPIPHDWVAFGELGLAGEVRPVPSGPDRLREAAKHGFKCAIVPAANVPKKGIEGLQIIPVQRLEQAIDALD